MKRSFIPHLIAAVLLPSAAMAQLHFTTLQGQGDSISAQPATIAAAAPVVPAPTAPSAPATAASTAFQPKAVSAAAVAAAKSAMPDDMFDALWTSVRDCDFDSQKVVVIQRAMSLPDAAISSEQASDLLNLLNFDDRRLSALKHMAPNIVDRENDFMVLDAFTFSKGQSEAIKLLEY